MRFGNNILKVPIYLSDPFSLSLLNYLMQLSHKRNRLSFPEVSFRCLKCRYIFMIWRYPITKSFKNQNENVSLIQSEIATLVHKEKDRYLYPPSIYLSLFFKLTVYIQKWYLKSKMLSYLLRARIRFSTSYKTLCEYVGPGTV